MRRHSFAALLAALAGALLSPASVCAYQAGALKNHAHSSTSADGGATLTPSAVYVSTLAATAGGHGVSSATIRNLSVTGTLDYAGAISPTTLSLSGGATFYQLAFSTCVYLIGSRSAGTAAVFSGVTQSSLTWTSAGAPGYVTGHISWYSDSANYMTFGAYLNGVLQVEGDGVSKGGCAWYVTGANVTYSCSLRIPISPIVGSNTISLAFQAGASGVSTITFGGYTAGGQKGSAARFCFEQR